MKRDRDIIRRIRHIGRVSVDEDSSDRAIERARRAVLGAPSPVRRRAAINKTRVPIAVSVLSIIGAAVAATFLFWQPSDASVAFAKVQDRIQKTRSITFVETHRFKGRPDESVRATILASGLARFDNADGSYSILDVRKGKSMAVSADRKRVFILHEMPSHVPMNLYEYVKNMHENAATELPARTINGIEAVGFSVVLRHDVLGNVIESNVNIWVNPRTNLPVLIEGTLGQDYVTVIHDIRFDDEIDESLFHFEPPVGSDVKEYGSAQPPTAAAKEVLDRIRTGKPAAPNSDNEVVRLSDVLALWDSGQKDDAVLHLGSIDWDSPAVLADIPAASLSENDFMSFGQDERALIQEEAIKFAGTAKELMGHAFSLSQQALNAGDRRTAKEYYEPVRRLGNALSGPGRLKVLQLVGEALVRMTEEKFGGSDELSDVFTSWKSGDKDGAAQLLLSVRWNEPDLISGAPILSLSEQEFMSLPRNEKRRVQNEANAFIELGRHALSLGENAKVSGDKQEAKLYYEAVLNLGHTLSDPKGMTVTQMMGKALVSQANEKLSTLQ